MQHVQGVYVGGFFHLSSALGAQVAQSLGGIFDDPILGWRNGGWPDGGARGEVKTGRKHRGATGPQGMPKVKQEGQQNALFGMVFGSCFGMFWMPLGCQIKASRTKLTQTCTIQKLWGISNTLHIHQAMPHQQWMIMRKATKRKRCFSVHRSDDLHGSSLPKPVMEPMESPHVRHVLLSRLDAAGGDVLDFHESSAHLQVLLKKSVCYNTT